jgi:hypothetical protein
VVLLYERISQRASGPAGWTFHAHILVHEIAHMLQGVPRHSETGVMKANFDARDQFQMTRKRLSFSAEDIALIHRGIDSRHLFASNAGGRVE